MTRTALASAILTDDDVVGVDALAQNHPARAIPRKRPKRSPHGIAEGLLQDLKTSANPVTLVIMEVTAREHKCDDGNIV
jgi:hypothetical protein